jgi:hypothetical protein
MDAQPRTHLVGTEQECTCDAALQQLLSLVYIMAINSEFKIKLVEDGVIRYIRACYP